MPNSNRPQKLNVIKPVLDIINAKMTEKGLIDGMNAIINGQTNFESDNPKISKPSFE